MHNHYAEFMLFAAKSRHLSTPVQKRPDLTRHRRDTDWTLLRDRQGANETLGQGQHKNLILGALLQWKWRQNGIFSF